MKNHLTIFFLFICSFNILTGQEPETIFNLANASYEKADYTMAINQYEKLIKLGYESEELYFNLGNSYYKSRQIGNAILHYERALRISPGNKDIEYNLRLLNDQTVDKIEIIPRIFFMQWWFDLSGLYSSDYWSRILLITFTLSCIFFGLFYYVLSPERKKGVFVIFLMFLSISLLSLCFSKTQNLIEKKDTEAIILNENIYVKTAPGQSSDDKFILHEGTKVSILEVIEGWHEIRLTDGKRGWAPSNSLGVI